MSSLNEDDLPPATPPRRGVGGAGGARAQVVRGPRPLGGGWAEPPDPDGGGYGANGVPGLRGEADGGERGGVRRGSGLHHDGDGTVFAGSLIPSNW